MSQAAFTLGRRTDLITVGQSLAKASGLVLALILVRILNNDEWATIALLFSIYSVATAFGGMNIHQGIYFFYSRLDPGARRLLAVQTTGLLAITGILTAGIILGLEPWLAGSPFQVAGLLGWLAIAVVLEVPTLGAPQLLLAAERAGGSAAFTTVSAVFQIIAVTTPLLLGLGLTGAMMGLTAYAAIRFVVYAGLVLGLTPPGPVRVDWSLIKEQVVYTAPLGLSMGTAVLTRNVGKWFVAAFDAPNFGAYAIAATEVPFVSIVPYALGAVLATRLVHAFKSGRTDLSHGYWMASTSRMSLLVIPATIGIVLCAPQLIVLLFTSEYVAATLPFQIHSVILLHRVAEYGIMLRAAGDTRSLWWASFVLLLANVIFGLPATLLFGMLGAAVAMLAANVIAWLFILWRIAHVMRVGLRAVFPWTLYTKVLLVALIAALMTAWLARVAPETAGMQLTVRALLFGGICLTGIFVVRLHRSLPGVPEDDPDFLREAVR
jgi:O-antigen/teichoic acid export membrane protein